MGFDLDVKFYSQNVSFVLIGLIVLTSIRGLLIALTKVMFDFSVSLIRALFAVLLRDQQQQIVKHHRAATGADYGRAEECSQEAEVENSCRECTLFQQCS